MELTTQRRNRRLKYTYEGKSIQAGRILYVPIKITKFEYTSSAFHPDKQMVVAQIHYVGKGDEVMHNTLFTESYTLLSTLKGTEESLPHYTKIIRKSDGYYYFVKINAAEKELLILI